MAQYSPSKYDIGIVNTDGVNVGLMLVQDKYGTPVYAEYDDEYLAAQYFTGTPGYGNLPPEKELAIRQDSWRSGISDDIYDSTRPEGYYRSKGMDLRFKGMAMAGFKVNSVAINTTGLLPIANINNPNFDVNTTGWTLGAGAIGNTVNARYGSSCMTLTAASNMAIATYPIDWSTNYQSQVFTFNAWGRMSFGTAPGFSIGIDDGISITNSANSLATDYTKLSVQKTLDASATKLNLILRFINDGTVHKVFFDDVCIDATKGYYGNPKAFADFNDQLYMAHGSFVSKLDGDGDAFDTVKANVAGMITDLEPFTDDQLYIATNYNAPYQIMNKAEAFVTTTLYPYFRYFQTVLAANPTMWGNQSVWQLRSTTDPTSSAWSGVTNVAASYDDITDLITKSGALYVMKEDKPYYLDSSGNVLDDLAPELESLRSAASGKNAFIWKNKLYIPCGAQGLLETDGTTNRFINPAGYATNVGDYTGRVMAVAGDEEWLFVAVHNPGRLGTAGATEILAGREETVGGTTEWVWHPIAEFASGVGEAVETMYISTVYKKRLWIATKSSANPLYYITLPTKYGNITEDTNRDFQSNTFFETPFLHANFKDTDKAYPQLDVAMVHTYNPNLFFQAHYKTLSNSTYTHIANYTGSATSMFQTNYLPLNPSDKMIRLKFTANTANAQLTPIMSSFNLKGVLYPPKRTIIACTARCADSITLKDGTIDSSSTVLIKSCLDEGKEASWPVTMYDVDGNVRYVKFLPLPQSVPRWTLHKDEKGQRQERHYNLLLQEVELS